MLFSQNNGDYLSKRSGAWADKDNWLKYVNNSWTDSPDYPQTNSSSVITIENCHIMTIGQGTYSFKRLVIFGELTLLQDNITFVNVDAVVLDGGIIRFNVNPLTLKLPDDCLLIVSNKLDKSCQANEFGLQAIGCNGSQRILLGEKNKDTYTACQGNSGSAGDFSTVNGAGGAFSVSFNGPTGMCSARNANFSANVSAQNVGASISYHWSLIQKPATSTIVLNQTSSNSSNLGQINFDKNGVYLFELKVVYSIQIGNKNYIVTKLFYHQVVVGDFTEFNGIEWSKGIPSDVNYLNAKISAPFTTSSTANIDACSCEVSNSGSLTIAPNTYVKVQSNIVNNGTLTVENDGNLIQVDDSAVNTGSISVRSQHTLTSLTNRNQYNYVSSPVVGQNMKAIYGGNAGNMPFATVLSEPANMFVNATTADYAIKGKGFSVKEPVASGFVNTNGLGNDGLAQYQGVPNNGVITTPITRTGTRGWNLIGNPYPSNIDLKKFYEGNKAKLSTAEFRFWDNRKNNTYTQYGGKYNGYSYAIYNAESNVGNPAPGGDAGNNTGTVGGSSITPAGLFRYAKVGQGFLVRAEANGDLTFNNSYRVKDQATSFFGRKASGTNRDLYQLQLVTPDKLVLTQTIVYYDGGDRGFGLEDSKHPSLSSSDVFYGFAGDERVVINGRDVFRDSDIIRLGNHHFIAGTYKVRSIERSGTFSQGQSIYLKDNLLNTLTDLTKGDYEFQTNAGEYTGRFEIVYTTDKTADKITDSVLNTLEANRNGVKIYRNGDSFVVETFQVKMKNIEIYDLSGKLVLKSKLDSNQFITTSSMLKRGVFLFRIHLQNNQVYTQKVLNN